MNVKVFVELCFIANILAKTSGCCGSSSPPVYCELDVTKSTMDCSKANDAQQLYSHFKKYSAPKEVSKFYIYNNSVEVFKDPMEGLTFEKIHLIRVPKLTEISEDFLMPSREILKGIRVWNSGRKSTSLKKFPFSSLHKFPKLESLYLDDTLISELPQLNSSTLTNFTLKFSSLTQLLAGTLDGLPQLKFLDLTYNDLVSLDSGSLPVHQNQMIFDISDNKISQIHEDVFLINNNGHEISVVDLHSNRLEGIGGDFCEDMAPFIKKIRLYDNPLNCSEVCPTSMVPLSPSLSRWWPPCVLQRVNTRR